MSILLFPFKLLVAGAWASVWHWGLGIGVIALCLFGAFFSNMIPVIGPFLGSIRKLLIIVAVATALIMVGEYVGDIDGANRCTAKEAVVGAHVDEIVIDVTKTPPSVKSDPWNSKDN